MGAEDIRNAKERLTKAISALGGTYTGESYNALNQAWQESQPTLVKLVEAIDAFAPSLESTAENQRQLEVNAAKTMRNQKF